MFRALGSGCGVQGLNLRTKGSVLEGRAPGRIGQAGGERGRERARESHRERERESETTGYEPNAGAGWERARRLRV